MSARSRCLLVAALLGVVALLAAPLASARTTRNVACSTRGLQVSGAHGASYRVVSLEASGYSCSAARGLARRLAESLLTTGSIPLSGGSVSYSTVTCTGCATRDTISLSEASGSIELTLEGAKGAAVGGASPSEPLPAPAPAPSPGSVIA